MMMKVFVLKKKMEKKLFETEAKNLHFIYLVEEITGKLNDGDKNGRKL